MISKPGRFSKSQMIGLLFGPVLALGLYFLLPAQYSAEGGILTPFPVSGRVTAALAAWMAVWWMTEAISLYATALLPLVVLPLFGASSMKQAASPYAHELIFLFMGGFLLALSMQRWNLHKRIAYFALGLVGGGPARIVGGFMMITAVLSMWVSNTATSIMMLPIAISVLDLLHSRDPAPDEKAWGNFRVCLLLGVAYSASIGGIGTLIGTPPNLFLASFIKTQFGREISFVKWMAVGLPLVAVFLPLTWIFLTRFLFPTTGIHLSSDHDLGRRQLKELGPMSRGEWITFLVFMTAAFFWIFRPWLADLTVLGAHPLSGLTDSGIAMAAALLLFVIPVNFKEGVFAMNWEWGQKLPWGLLILFGGGLSLAASIKETGVGELIANAVQFLRGFPTLVLIIAVVAGVIFLTELTSNTATTATLVPILSALAPGLGIHPFALIIPAAIAASCAFMLPVATPPNAVVFGSGYVGIKDMTRAGLWLNLAGVVLITALAYGVALPLLAG